MSSPPTRSRDEADELALSLVRGDALLRVQRAVGLVPRDGLGVGRRALFFAALSWLPIAVWALLAGRAFPGATAEPLLQHFGVHVRCLVAIPLFILAEGVGHGLTTRLVPYFLHSGLVAEGARTRFAEIVRGVARLRDATLPWIAILALVLAWALLSPAPRETHEVIWAEDGPRLGFGGFWFLYVARPIYLGLLFGWLWRLVLLTVLFVRLGALGLDVVPTHPDGAGGLGFLERLPTMFSPVVFAVSAVLASRFAHDVLHHGVQVQSLRLPMLGFGVLVLVLFLAPLAVWARPLGAAKRRALFEYGTLVGRHGRLVRRRWILREPVEDDALLAAPEIGPVADTLALYEAVRKLRSIPISRVSLLAIALPALVPMLPVVAIEIPIRDLLLKILSTLA
ncbi:MAG TPA: hypothetical protein VFG80_08095 [Myxococcota bacterium]|nr:hypothetical protein [Myxococcota bacterium]